MEVTGFFDHSGGFLQTGRWKRYFDWRESS
jgi:hypothetical protein